VDIEAQRGLLWLVAGGDQASEQMHEEIVGTTVTRMLDLARVFELINDGLNERTFAQEQLIGERKEPVAHVRAQLGDEAQPLTEKETLSEGRGDVALVTKEPTDQAGNGLTIVHSAGNEAPGQQFATPQQWWW
jgi:hypothetical protein